MRLIDKNFFRNELTITVGTTPYKCIRYGYDSASGLYDVDTFPIPIPISQDGGKITRLYNKNMRRVSEPEAIHKAIEKHFAL